ncbi:MAG: hypothetical protein R3268_00775 [Acidiferrobacterales bacterium]|nr:hypothetical protein [Acidiferrobacterales bacterium]
MALFYAGGPRKESTRTAGSAFSAGDPLSWDASSHLSRADDGFAAGIVMGVAIADSTQSRNDQVPYIVAQPDTVYWSDCTNDASTFTAGEALDLAYDASIGYYVLTSANTATVRVAEDGEYEDLVDSGTSRVLVRFDNTVLSLAQ